MSSCLLQWFFSTFHSFHFLLFHVHKLSTFSHSSTDASGAQIFIVRFSYALLQFRTLRCIQQLFKGPSGFIIIGRGWTLSASESPSAESADPFFKHWSKWACRFWIQKSLSSSKQFTFFLPSHEHVKLPPTDLWVYVNYLLSAASQHSFHFASLSFILSPLPWNPSESGSEFESRWRYISKLDGAMRMRFLLSLVNLEGGRGAGSVEGGSGWLQERQYSGWE